MRKNGWWRLLAFVSALHLAFVAVLLYQNVSAIPPASQEQDFRAKAALRLLVGRGDLSPYADLDRRYKIEGHATDEHIARLLTDDDHRLISTQYAEHLAEHDNAVSSSVFRHASVFALPVLFCVVLLYAVPWIANGFRQ